MINITINGETVTIREKVDLKDLLSLNCYPVSEDGRVALMIPKELDTPKNLAQMDLYVAGILCADTTGSIETVTDEIEFGGLNYNTEWEAYTGVFVNGDFNFYNAQAGIKILFGRRD